MKQFNLKLFTAFALAFFTIAVFFLFFIFHAEVSAQTGLVTCENDCGFNKFLDLVNKVVDFIFKNLILPLAAVMFAYAGFVLVTSGGSTEKKSKAKKIFTNVAIGLIIAAAAFLIVQTLLSIAGVRTDVGIDWFGFL